MRIFRDQGFLGLYFFLFLWMSYAMLLGFVLHYSLYSVLFCKDQGGFFLSGLLFFVL